MLNLQLYFLQNQMLIFLVVFDFLVIISIGVRLVVITVKSSGSWFNKIKSKLQGCISNQFKNLKNRIFLLKT